VVYLSSQKCTDLWRWSPGVDYQGGQADLVPVQALEGNIFDYGISQAGRGSLHLKQFQGVVVSKFRWRLMSSPPPSVIAPRLRPGAGFDDPAGSFQTGSAKVR
jgi:hypothetical protein